MSLCLLLLPTAARAGHYTTTYTGGGYNSYGASGANAGYGTFLSQNGGKPLTAALNSQITATFTWQPDYSGDGPPDAAVVLEDSQVGWGYGSNDSGSGNTGLSGGLISSGGTLSPCRSGQSSLIHFLQQTKYSTKAGPGTTFSVTCTPSATDSLTYDYGLVGVSVGYIATATPVIVTIQLTGQNSAYQALVGQQITAQAVTNIGTVVGNAWGANGSAFKTYDPGRASGQLVPLSYNDGDFSGQKFFFYDVVGGETVMVTDYPNVQLPDGTTVNVTAKSANVTFKKPSTIWHVQEGYIRSFTLSQLPGDLLYGLGPDPTTTNQNGENWNPVDITMPSGFASAGTGGFTQLVTPNHTGTHNGTTIGGLKPQGLDNTFAAGQWTLPGQGSSGDNPYFKTNATINGGCVAGDQLASDDQFTTYVMYLPPAVGSQGTIWAPLQKYDWTAKTTITYDGSQWNIVSAQSAPTTPTPDAIKGTDTDVPPQWSATYTNGQ